MWVETKPVYSLKLNFTYLKSFLFLIFDGETGFLVVFRLGNITKVTVTLSHVIDSESLNFRILNLEDALGKQKLSLSKVFFFWSSACLNLPAFIGVGESLLGTRSN